MTADLVVALSLFTACCFGLQALVVGRGLDGASDLDAPAFAAALVSVVVSLVAFWGVALVRGASLPADPARLRPFVAAGVLYPAAFRLLYYAGIDRVGPSVSAAVVTANPVVAVALAVVAFGAPLPVSDAVGLLAVVGGGALLQFVGKSAGPDADDPVLTALGDADPRAFAYPVGAALAVGVGYVVVDWGLAGFPRPLVATAVTQTTAAVVFAGAAVVSPARRRTARAVWTRPRALVPFVVAGALVAAAWLGQFAALRLGDVVVVLPLVYTYPLLVVGATYAAAGAPPRSPRLLGAVVAIVAGVALTQVA
ncbi:MAG: EamA family transporter [Halobacteriaceae archaeon]